MSATQMTFSRSGASPSEERSWFSITLRDLCASFPRFVLCDTSDTDNPGSDYKTAVCMMLTDHNELLILDVWQEQTSLDAQVLNAFLMAEKWEAFLISPELVRMGVTLQERLRDIIATQALNTLGVTHTPLVEGFRPGTMPKTAKISAMKWRFEHGLIKMPLYHRHPGMRTPVWCALFEQIECFRNRGGDDTGLFKDDLVDTVSMHRFIISGLPTAQETKAPVPVKTLQELLAEGDHVAFQFAPRAAVHEALAAKQVEVHTKSPRNVEV